MKAEIGAFLHSCEHKEPTVEEVEEVTRKLLHWQYENIPLYKRFIGSKPSDFHKKDYPIPTPLFTRFRFCAGEHTTHFRTSGTTSGARGNHFMPDADIYALAVKTGVGRLPFSIPLKTTFSLCPNAAEFPDSSLGHMIQILSPQAQSFFSKQHGVLSEACWAALQTAKTPVFLASTALALAALLETGASAKLPAGSVLMITGGYKGQLRSIPESELHDAAKKQLGSDTRLIREYGMTELSSQLWDWGEGYRAPPWLRAYTQFDDERGVGQLCFVDLANWGSCMAIETQDMGRVRDGVVELFGRIPGMKARGCSLVVEEIG
jgi:hypothetical protein